MYLLGLDIGTTGCKANIFNDFIFKKTFYKSYPSIRNEKEAIIDIDKLRESIFDIIQESLEEFPYIEAIGITSFGESFVLLDKDDNVLFDCMLLGDPRGLVECSELEKDFGNDYLKRVTGQYANPTLSFSKILYVKNNYPQVFEKVKRLMLIEDYAVYLLTGVQQIDYSLAARTQCFDVYKKSWDENLMTKYNIPVSIFSKPVRTGTIAGNLKSELSNNKNIKVINISHDQISNLVGSGASKIGDVADGIGTCECLTATFNDNINSDILAKYGFGIIPSFTEDTYCCYGYTSTAGACNDWFIKTFNSFNAKGQNFEYFNSRIKNKPTDLFFLPYLSGSGTPYNEVRNYGSIIGLNLSTTREEIYQSIIESLCFENKLNIDLISKAGVKIKKLYVTGGCSLNDNWLQLKANILGLPVYQMTYKDAGTIGAIAIMMKSIGRKENLNDLVGKLNPINKVFNPDKEINKLYGSRYNQYIKLYKVLKKEGF